MPLTEISASQASVLPVTLTYVLKRSGDKVPFDSQKITEAIFKAAQSVGGQDHALAECLSVKVVSFLVNVFQEDKMPTVENVQDYVEKVLIESGHAKTAKAYILYRERHRQIREAKGALGTRDEMKLSVPALKLLEQRFLRRDKENKVIETPSGLLHRVATHVATADSFYERHGNRGETEATFYEMMHRLAFLPHPAILLHAGTEHTHLAGYFSFRLSDELESIFDTVKRVALLARGEVFLNVDFSSLRPKGEMVGHVAQSAMGPVAFSHLFEEGAKLISHAKGGGVGRRLAPRQWAQLRVDHPDILEYLTEEKNAAGAFFPFVVLTEGFMEALSHGATFDLVSPRNKTAVVTLQAQHVFELLTMALWKRCAPGILFLRPGRFVGPGGAHLGTLHLSHFVEAQPDGRFRLNAERLREVAQGAVHFLDNALDLSQYQESMLDQAIRVRRPLGIAVSGFADLLERLGVSYLSPTAKEMARQIMAVIREGAEEASSRLAEKRGGLSGMNVRHAFRTALIFSEIEASLAGETPGIVPSLDTECSPSAQLAMQAVWNELVDFSFPQPIYAATPSVGEIRDWVWEAYRAGLSGFWLEKR